ncbi:hypothetical protein HC766_08115 [Candidatus Gracilibacteria bacterium]|nr:hypothetical protein [Candidatus Gracilibacteria bacterium]
MYSFVLYVFVDIKKQKSVIEVDWKTIKRLLPITGIRMSRNVLAISYIDLFNVKNFLNRLKTAS